MQGLLILSDGKTYDGVLYGDSNSTPPGVEGEVVFTTAMTGYNETLTDPSYRGQILVFTNPLIGNYGVPLLRGCSYLVESEQIQVPGLVVGEISRNGLSDDDRAEDLLEWCASENILVLSGVDTRSLTIHLRDHGSLLGRIHNISKYPKPNIDNLIRVTDPNLSNLVDLACRTPNEGSAPCRINEYKTSMCDVDFRYFEEVSLSITDEIKTIIVVDFGVKESIITQLEEAVKEWINIPNAKYDERERTEFPYKVVIEIVRWDSNFGEMGDGILLSNGPGDPAVIAPKIKRQVERAQMRNIPIFGICLGHQLLALINGGETYKMKFGNRGVNHPVINLRTGKSYITSQNHGFAVIPPKYDWVETWVNLNDGSNEGMQHIKKPFWSVQFHPEGSPGSLDTVWLFDDFVGKVLFPDKAEEINILPRPRILDRFNTITKVLLLGSGGLSIGQAGEFDYSGNQAIKAFKELGIYIILINPNIATVQTEPSFCHKTYFLPLTYEFISKVIEKERPDGILYSYGGQTALNCAKELVETDVLIKNNCRLLGTPITSVIATENRTLFVQHIEELGYYTAPSQPASNISEALLAAKKIGFPVLLRAEFELGGLWSGFCENEEDVKRLARPGVAMLVDKALRGWKEVELEIVRDIQDNVVVVAMMENFDPLGIHTGDSIVVCPVQTLTDDEVNQLRNMAINIVRHFEVIGECNIQFAISTDSDEEVDMYEEIYVIEMNARLSRSSALASKATGYPLAYVSAKCSLGLELPSMVNAVTGKTCCFFEPSLDYIVVKVPRWDIGKFVTANQHITSAMKSVGEVMGIGRNFEEAFQKALRMVDSDVSSVSGFESLIYEKNSTNNKLTDDDLNNELKYPSHKRVWALSVAFERKVSIEKLHDLTKIDHWFLYKLEHLNDIKMSLKKCRQLDKQLICKAKKYGFSDAQIELHTGISNIGEYRYENNIHPYIKLIDTTAGEFPSQTNYLYATYNACESDVEPLENAIAVLGCGCYRIGSSVEFDWSAVSAVKCIRECRKQYKTIVVNCNPETVSTDFDESDRLYFEELSTEVLYELLVLFEKHIIGSIISVGGQAPNNVVNFLYNKGLKVLGTNPESIDRCENRQKFSMLCDDLQIPQPLWSCFTNVPEAKKFCLSVGYPVLVRPSYVLSGYSMQVIHEPVQLEYFLNTTAIVSQSYPVIITKFINNAKEVEMDAVAYKGEIINYAISEHIENAGIHSGDATLILPAQKLYVETIKRVQKFSRKLAKSLNITGPFNVQYICQNNTLRVIECNLRASRTFPFISKYFNFNFIDLATRAMLDLPVKPYKVNLLENKFIAIKMPVFSFMRLQGSDPILGVEMQSTGEVSCFGSNKYECLLKTVLATGHSSLPSKDIVISIGPLNRKLEFEPYFHLLLHLNFSLYLTEGTYDFYMSRWDSSYAALSDLDIRWGDYLKNLPENREFLKTKIFKILKTKPASYNINQDEDYLHDIVQPNINQNNENYNNTPVGRKMPLRSSSSFVLDKIQDPDTHLVINISDTPDNQKSGNSPTNESVSTGFLIRRAAVDRKILLVTDIKLAIFLVDSLASKIKFETNHPDKTFWEIEPLHFYAS